MTKQSLMSNGQCHQYQISNIKRLYELLSRTCGIEPLNLWTFEPLNLLTFAQRSEVPPLLRETLEPLRSDLW